MITPGQIWENGTCIVKIENDPKGLELVKFNKDSRLGLRFSGTKVFEEEDIAHSYLTELNCELTDKSLVIEDLMK